MADNNTADQLIRIFLGPLTALLIALTPAKPGDPKTGKAPIGRNWKDPRLSEFDFARRNPAAYASSRRAKRRIETLARHIDAGGNIGFVIPLCILCLDADDIQSADYLTEHHPNAPYQRTSKGGHMFFRVPLDFAPPQSTKVKLNEECTVDLKVGGKGQVVVEPSTHYTGYKYTWEVLLPADLAEVEELPDEYRKAIANHFKKSPPRRPSPLKPAKGDVEGETIFYPKGTQHNRLVSYAGSLRRAGARKSEIYAALLVRNRDCCEEPGTDTAMEKIANSNWPRGRGADDVPEYGSWWVSS
jgi:hypothetical protein